jgi:hypothetical protein
LTAGLTNKKAHQKKGRQNQHGDQATCPKSIVGEFLKLALPHGNFTLAQVFVVMCEIRNF